MLSKTELPYVTLHGLRHSFASIANSQNVPLFGISRALGHSTTNTTTRIYMHLFDDTHLSVVQAVGEAVGGSGPNDLPKDPITGRGGSRRAAPSCSAPAGGGC